MDGHAAGGKQKLNIIFGGLCMFAPDLNPKPDEFGVPHPCVHVLLPKVLGGASGAHAGHVHGDGGDVPEHFTKLYYSRVHDTAGMATKALLCHDLRDCSLEIGKGRFLDPLLPGALAEIYDVAGLTGRPENGIEVDHLENISRAFVDGAPPADRMATRVSLFGGAAAVRDQLPPGIFSNKSYPASRRWAGPLATKIGWTIDDMPSGPLELTIRPFDASKPTCAITLRPNTQGAINLTIVNLPLSEIPPFPKRDDGPAHSGTKADHYGAFYQFFSKISVQVIPELLECTETAPRSAALESNPCKPCPPGLICTDEPVQTLRDLEILCPDVIACAPSKSRIAPWRP
jgi:hypothetical protein